MADDWRPIESAPRDGTEICLQLFSSGVAAYWDQELERFVLSQPLHVESVITAAGWRALVPEAG